MRLVEVCRKRLLKGAPQGAQSVPEEGDQIISFAVSHRITGQPANTGSQQVSTR
jgi:hypothetical protein